jgi:ABC-type bacteriocin/lantibiotic exporter with double-glycine peptidase domain
MLFYYLGISFFSGIGVFVVGFIVNFAIGKKLEKYYAEVMKKKDARMETTTESLNNIKMLKLYSWNDIFLKKIKDRRTDEIKSM